VKRLRHPIRAIREPFGTAGLIVAMVALVAALGGTALAASKLNSTQKKEVEKIAKKYAGKPGAPGAQGPAGPTGSAGKNGTDGTNGTNGKDGTSGTNGTNGKSVTVSEIPVEEAECEERGGAMVAQEGSASGVEVCDGEEGSPWTDGGTLPPGATETGVFTLTSSGAPIGRYQTALSLPIQLVEVEGFDQHMLISGVADSGEFTAECGSPFAEHPAPKPGVFCVYAPEHNEATEPEVQTASGGSGVSPSGAFLSYVLGENGSVRGSFAVTGCSTAPGAEFPCP
jgi:Collagen triple helix repeat (20 copies)